MQRVRGLSVLSVAAALSCGSQALDAVTSGTGPLPDPVIMLPSGTLELQVWNPRTIRVIYGNGATTPMPSPSLAVNQPRPETPFTVTDGATELTVTTSQLQAQVDKSSGQVTFLTPGGSVILAEASTKPHQLNQAPSGPGPYTSIGTFTP